MTTSPRRTNPPEDLAQRWCLKRLLFHSMSWRAPMVEPNPRFRQKTSTRTALMKLGVSLKLPTPKIGFGFVRDTPPKDAHVIIDCQALPDNDTSKPLAQGKLG
jgi:hypothetical protein